MATSTLKMNRALYNEQIEANRKADELKRAQEEVKGYEDTIKEGVETLQLLRSLHLEVTGKFGADYISSAIRNIESELSYQEDYRKRAQTRLDRIQGEKPVETGREF